MRPQSTLARLRPACLVVLVGLGICAGRSHADDPRPGAVDAPEVIVTQPDESKFPEIAVYFELKRPDGSFVLDATRDLFRVTEDGRDRPILEFDAPVTVRKQQTTIVLVLDVSGSMVENDGITGLKQAVQTFMGAIPEESRVAVIAFSTEVRLICPFTTNRRRIIAAVNNLNADGGTRYYDAVNAALELLAEQTGRRAILAMTDGKDTASFQANLKTVIARAQKLNLPVHTLGLGNGAISPLRQLAGGTRGQYYAAADADQLRQIYEEIARRIESTYRLTYATDRRIPDGTLRPIEIFYAQAKKAGQAAIFIRGMVVPARGWSRLFLVLLAGLVGLAVAPSILRQRRQFRTMNPAPPVPPTP